VSLPSQDEKRQKTKPTLGRVITEATPMTLRLFSLDCGKCLFQPACWKDANLPTADGLLHRTDEQHANSPTHWRIQRYRRRDVSDSHIATLDPRLR